MKRNTIEFLQISMSILTLGLLFSGCGSVAPSVCSNTTVHVRQLSLPVYLSPSPEWLETTTKAANAWNLATNSTLFTVIAKGGKEVSFSYENWRKSGMEDWQAYTDVHWTGDFISDFSIRINPMYDGRYDRYSLLVHELGHSLGLGHYFSQGGESAMQPFLGSKEVNRGPDTHSVQMLKCMYNLR